MCDCDDISFFSLFFHTRVCVVCFSLRLCACACACGGVCAECAARQVDGLKREIVLLQKAKEDSDGASKQEMERLKALCAEQEEKLSLVT